MIKELTRLNQAFVATPTTKFRCDVVTNFPMPTVESVKKLFMYLFDITFNQLFLFNEELFNPYSDDTSM